MAATKAIAARIPMEEFIKFQRKAIGLKMSMNEFLIMKLYENENDKEIDYLSHKNYTDEEAKNLYNELRKLRIGVNSVKVELEDMYRKLSEEYSNFDNKDLAEDIDSILTEISRSLVSDEKTALVRGRDV